MLKENTGKRGGHSNFIKISFIEDYQQSTHRFAEGKVTKQLNIN